MSAAFDTTTVRWAGAGDAGPAADALQRRANILTMTQEAEDAVLAPRDAGAFSHALRAALAARMARLCGDETAAAGFEARIDSTGGKGESEWALLAHPAHDAAGTPHATLVSFVDKAAATPRDVSEADVAALKAAGVGDADIVRLCELIAFVAYQLRLIAGLRLLAGGAL